ncbi:MAG: hypothetical protein Q9193_000041 [Seirophora villosa]
MATFHQATFEIISGGKTCSMYEDPEQNDEENPFQQQRYIEAVTGAPFEVLLTLRPAFKFGTCDAVRVDFCFDNMSAIYYVDIKREDAGKQCFARLSHMCRNCPETGVREQGQLTFAKLDIKTLQMLGCMPRSPSPEPVDRSTAISTLPSDIAIREELVALRARLAELERNQPIVKPERARVEPGVKRERDDKENQAPRKRNRRIETIDLTDD